MLHKQLVLFRHAKSDWYSDAGTDHDRPLNHRGRRDAPVMGQWLADSGYLPDLILCSDACRTRETLELASGTPGWEGHDPKIFHTRQLYLASRTAVLDMIDDRFGACDRLMVIGHNPTLDDLLLHFCPDALFNGSGKLMTTAAIAVLDIDPDNTGAAVLRELVRPADLRG